MRQATIYQGHVLDGLRTLPSGCAQTVVTSPPYWGLRDYGLPASTWGDGWVGCLGLEPTPDLYIAHLVEVFREVRRVLREDGTVWLNLGDSYCTVPHGPAGSNSFDPKWQGARERGAGGQQNRKRLEGLKSGDMVGIPWRAALALQADGWWLRSDVVWSKPNPMPESVAGVRWERHRIQEGPSRRAVGEKKETAYPGKPGGARNPADSSSFASRAEWTDCPGCPECDPNGGLVLRRGAWRPTKGHEYVFLLAKSGSYFADQEAVREPHTMRPQARPGGRKPARPDGLLPAQTYSTAQREDLGVDGNPAGRNLRTVWEIATAPYPGAHFATFPPDLVEPCIKAGTSAGGRCLECGAPWAPVVSVSYTNPGNRSTNGSRSIELRHQEHGTAGFAQRLERQSLVHGYRPSCNCAAPSAPCLVLDPFSGAGTTALVSLRLGRCFVGCELSPEYVRQSVDRIAGDAPLLNQVEIKGGE